MLALLSFIILLIVFVYIKSPRLSENEPPLVPYTIPVIGHTLNYIFNPDSFLKKCLKEYGEPFNIIVFGKVTTIVAQKYIPEVLKAHESFNAFEALKELMPIHLIFDYDPFAEVDFHAKTTREHISGKLSSHFDHIQNDIFYILDKFLGKCNEPKSIKDIWKFSNHITAKSIANVCVGEEASLHDDIVHTFTVLSDDMSRWFFFLPPILTLIHQKLHEFVVSLPFLIGFNPVSKHKKILINRMKPVVEKRIQQKKILGDSYKPSNDLLEFYMSQPNFDPSNVNYSYLADLIMFLIVVGIGTTGRSLAFLLQDYAGRPEYWDEMYEEVSTINKESNGKLTFDDTRKMIKLDSFIRESLRHVGDIFIIPHIVSSDYYTFSNGYTIPKGRQVFDYSPDCLFSEKYGPDSKSFKPFQFTSQNISASKIDRNYVVFGGGRHACPGRFYAVLVMKLCLYHIILRYHVRTESGDMPKKSMLGPFTSPANESLIFEQRKE